jgi:hypothetical protein
MFLFWWAWASGDPEYWSTYSVRMLALLLLLLLL